MPRRKKASASISRRASGKSAERVRRAVPAEGRVLQRPDGFYWERGGELHGPYESRSEAEIEMLAGAITSGEEELEAGESLAEAESELGVAEWIDPDTGDPAEDHIPRLEDH